MNDTWKRVAIIIAVLVPVVIGGAMLFKSSEEYGELGNDDDQVINDAIEMPGEINTESTGTMENTVPLEDSSQSFNYTNGTYSATGSYLTPEGSQSIVVSLTVENDVVSSAVVTSNNPGPVSAKWQEKFISGVELAVVGKKLSSLHLTNVSGSSLTPKGFNTAVSEIQNQAKI